MKVGTESARKGRIVILNGTSSAGKSTIARSLQALLDGPALHLDVDHFRQIFPRDYFDVPERDMFRARVAHALFGVNRVAAALAAGGDDVIVDIVLSRWDVLRDAVERFRPFQVLFVALHCPVDELERRETERGDRRRGLARGQAAWVHHAGTYDLELDTSRCLPEGCARQIVEALAYRPSPSAFEQLSARFATGQIHGTFFRERE